MLCAGLVSRRSVGCVCLATMLRVGLVGKGSVGHVSETRQSVYFTCTCSSFQTVADVTLQKDPTG